MTVSAPPRRPGPCDPVDRDEFEALVEALIEEARQRARRRRLAFASVVGLVALVALSLLVVFDRTARSQASSPTPSAKAGADGATGSRIAFLSTQTRTGPAQGAALYVVDADGGGKRLLTETAFVARPESGSPPAWSPDGRRIAFLSLRHHNRDVYVLDLGGNKTHRVTRDPADDLEPAWSPDGQRIAFVSDRDRCTSSGCPGSELYVVNADGSDERRLTHTHLASWPSWSPDGLKIVFSGFPASIYVVNADGSGLRRLAPGGENPTWSPDGRRIVYVHSLASTGLAIYVMNADGSARHRLATSADEPSWSPDGTRIAFLRGGRLDQPEIYVVNADGTGLRRLTNNRVWDQAPLWSPDGKKIAFFSQRDGIEGIYVMNTDGSDPRNVSHSEARGTGLFAWSPR